MANGLWATTAVGAMPIAARMVRCATVGTDIYAVATSGAGTGFLFFKFDTISNIPTNLTPPAPRSLYRINYGLAYDNINNKIILADSFYTTVGQSVPSAGVCAKYNIYDLNTNTWSGWQNWVNADLLNPSGGTTGLCDIHFDNGTLYSVMEKGVGISSVTASGAVITATNFITSTYGNLLIGTTTFGTGAISQFESSSIKVGNLIVIAGLPSNTQKVAKFNISNNTSSLSSTCTPATQYNGSGGGFSCTTLMNFGTKVYLMGCITRMVSDGTNYRPIDDTPSVMRVYDINNNTWGSGATSGVPMNPLRYSAPSSNVIGKSYVFGGLPGGTWGPSSDPQVYVQNSILSYGYELKAPSGVSSSIVNFVNVKLDWTDMSDEETSYIIERKADNETVFTTIGTLSPSSNTFTDLTSNIIEHSYTYRIIARLII